MKNLKYILFFLTIIIIAVFLTNQKKEIKISEKLIVVSTFSTYDIVKTISNGSLKIVNILPFGVDAHTYAPSPAKMVQIEKASLLIYSGAGLEPWTKGFIFSKRVLNLSKYVDLKELDESSNHHDVHHVHLNSLDPHYWLDVENMKKATNIITEKLIKISPKNKTEYLQRRDKYLIMLKNLDNKYKISLLQCKQTNLIVNHNAFNYLADKYNFNVESLSGLSPDSLPSAKSIINLIEIVKKYNISTIFFENFVSDVSIRAIAEEAKISVDVLQTLGNITANEFERNVTYEIMMLENLEKISKALSCH